MSNTFQHQIFTVALPLLFSGPGSSGLEEGHHLNGRFEDLRREWQDVAGPSNTGILMGVSINGGTPKWMVYSRKSNLNG